MSLIARTADSSHWYRMDGDLCLPDYERPKKDGKGMTATTLRHAREDKLLPSVTTILKVLDKPALTKWRIEQAILSAVTLPRKEGETVDSYAARILEDSEAQSGKAREMGTKIHDMIEAAITEQPFDPTAPEYPFAQGCIEWVKANVTKVLLHEECIGSRQLGYAGRLDLFAEFNTYSAVVDFKTQTVRNGKPAFYSEWGLQLAAYRAILGGTNIRCVSVVIDSQSPSKPYIMEWPYEEIARATEAFHKLLDIWCWQNEYDPRA